MRVSAAHKAVRCAGAAGRPPSLNINYLQHHRHLLGDYRTLCGVMLQSTDGDSASLRLLYEWPPRDQPLKSSQEMIWLLF